MKISESKKRTSTTEKSSARKSWGSSLLFWKKDIDNEYSDETFQTKREREAKKRKHRLVTIGIIALTMLSTITGIGVSLLSNMNIAPQKDVPNKALGDNPSDEAAKQILKGKTVKVSSKDSKKKMVDATKAKKALQDAVDAQKTKDKDIINKRNDQLAKLQSQIDSLAKANQSLTDQNSKLSSNASSAAAAMSSAQEQVDQYKKAASDAQSKASSLQSELDNANNEDAQTSADSTSNCTPTN